MQIQYKFSIDSAGIFQLSDSQGPWIYLWVYLLHNKILPACSWFWVLIFIHFNYLNQTNKSCYIFYALRSITSYILAAVWLSSVILSYGINHKCNYKMINYLSVTAICLSVLINVQLKMGKLIKHIGIVICKCIQWPGWKIVHAMKFQFIWANLYQISSKER